MYGEASCNYLAEQVRGALPAAAAAAISAARTNWQPLVAATATPAAPTLPAQRTLDAFLRGERGDTETPGGRGDVEHRASSRWSAQRATVQFGEIRFKTHDYVIANLKMPQLHQHIRQFEAAASSPVCLRAAATRVHFGASAALLGSCRARPPPG